MKPTVISNANVAASTGSGNPQTGGNDVTIPINHEYRGHKQTQFNTQPGHYTTGESRQSDNRNPGHVGRVQQKQPSHQQHQQDLPSHFQDFDFEPGVGVDMFPRTRLGRMTQDPFGDFGGTARKRSSLHDPHFHTDGFSRYFDEAADFGFPQFNSLGRRRINHHNDDDDLFNRFPSEFRQYIPESFAHRRAGTNMTASPGSGPTMVHPQHSAQQQPQSHFYSTIPPQSPSRKLCDAAIQTEDPTGRCEVDHIMNANAMDMGVPLSSSESQSPKSSSVPPMEQQQNQQQYFNTHPTQIPVNVLKRPTPPPTQQHQFATQTSPQVQAGGYGGQSPQFQKTYCAPQHQSHSQQQQQTPPPQATGGSYIRTIPIYVEGRSEPIINNKEIPNQNMSENSSPAPGNYRAFTPPKQQAQRLSPLNTQQQPTAQSSGPLPQTPHTVDTINKIQDIQRDVLALMSRVEKFTGTRVDKEYVYLDEMLTRNLLKLDNIDTNGKESIRLARKEAIKCIQASINVLEAKAEENKMAAQLNTCEKEEPTQEAPAVNPPSPQPAAETQKPTLAENTSKESVASPAVLIVEPVENKIYVPIPLPPPENAKFNEVKIEDCPEDDVPSPSINNESIHKPEDTLMENSPEAK